MLLCSFARAGSSLLERTKGGACEQESPLNRVGCSADGRKARAYLVTIIIIIPFFIKAAQLL
jgi:hypothetical protein